MNDEKDNQEGGQKSGQKGGQNLTENVFSLIKDNPNITRSQLVSITGKASSAIQKCIQKLKDDNRIKRVGGDRGGHWEILE